MPSTCRRCGGRGLRIVYGMPTEEMVNDPSIVIGGCMLAEFTHQCASCEFRWGGLPFRSGAAFEPLAEQFSFDVNSLTDALDDRFTPGIAKPPIVMGVGPAPIPDYGAQLILGDPPLVVLTMVEEAGEFRHRWIEVAEYRIGVGAEPMRWGALRTLALHHEPYDLQLRGALLASVIKDAARRRAAKFRKCSKCQLRQAPEEFAQVGRQCRGCDIKAATPPPEPTMTRAERLATQRDLFVAWAGTATTDEVPGELPGESPQDRPRGGATGDQ